MSDVLSGGVVVDVLSTTGKVLSRMLPEEWREGEEVLMVEVPLQSPTDRGLRGGPCVYVKIDKAQFDYIKANSGNCLI
jgi:hypothetical protein